MGKLAKTLLGRLGRPATLRRTTGTSSYAAATGAVAASTGDLPCEVVFSEFSDRQIDGTLVRMGDRKGLVSRLRLGAEPKPDADVLIEGGRTWRIVRVVGYSSGAHEAAYELHLRRG
jgi:hypothetical protein